jgi:hypothetical protein
LFAIKGFTILSAVEILLLFTIACWIKVYFMRDRRYLDDPFQALEYALGRRKIGFPRMAILKVPRRSSTGGTGISTRGYIM